MTATDEQLVSEIQEGKILSFEELVRRYQGRLFVFVQRIVGSPKDAEEIVQDSLFSLYRTITRVDTNKKFSTYVFAIAKNGALSYRRRRHEELPLILVDPWGETMDLEKEMLVFERRQVFGEALKRLEPAEARAVRLYYFEELSYEEISQRTAEPLNTVRTRLHRGKEKLRIILKDYAGN